MADEIETLLVAVRADTRLFARDVAAMKAELAGPFAAGAEQAGRMLENALVRALRTGKLGFDDLKRVALSAMAEIAGAAIRGGLDALFGKGGVGGLITSLGSLFTTLLGAPGKAIGGPVSPGRPYLVGERGPELFVPTASGRIETGRERGRAGCAAQHHDQRAGGERGAGAEGVGPAGGAGGAAGAAEGGGLTWDTGWRRRAARRRLGTVKRFDARYWTVNFPRPMMASVVTTGPHALRVETLFYARDDLAGLIWEAEDRWDHPLLAYETSAGFPALPAELPLAVRRAEAARRGARADADDRGAGRGGASRGAGSCGSGIMRTGEPEDALVSLDFGALAGRLGEGRSGLGRRRRPDVRLAGRAGLRSEDAPLEAPAEGWVELSGDRLRRLGLGAGDRRHDRAGAPAADRDRL